MKSYHLEFEVTQKFLYSASIEAESPEEALKKYKEVYTSSDHWPDDFDLGEEECVLESGDDMDTIKCVGEWVVENSSSCSLKRYDEPIKLEK